MYLRNLGAACQRWLLNKTIFLYKRNCNTFKYIPPLKNAPFTPSLVLGQGVKD